MPPLPEALAKLRAHVEHLKEEGAREVELSPGRLAALQRRIKQGGAVAAPTAKPSRPEPAPVREPAPARAAPIAKKPAAKSGDPVVGGLADIAATVAACKKCRLCESRTNVVPGQGNPRPEIMFIGEGPGADEDAQGLAFVGRAGQLLTKMIEAMGLTRDEVFIGNIVKCRPPDNRTPMPDEMAACIPYLEQQIALLKPRVIVALGGTAVKGLFNQEKISITKLRGTWMSYQGIDTMPTLHPAYLLRNPPAKHEAWEDLKAVLKHLGKPLPKRDK
ncbi:MAG TPA: uracil-DNA glycosylase [Kiritimatiellia bacterium]|nr:uracil-DNA glycosylase [Kiritimatiellia bacterium]